jgi:TRAP-type C4-dicarboxylate transport system substrate-binding protein
MDAVRDAMWSHFQKKFEKKGFVLGEPGDVGWVYFMSKTKVESLGDLRSATVWMWGDDQIVRAMFKKVNVSGVPLGVPEVAAGLTSGRINACYGSPLAAMALQWSSEVKYMTSMPMAYSIGATLVSTDAWNKLSEEDRKAVQKIQRAVSKKLRKIVRKDNVSAQKQMVSKGIKVVPTPPAMVADFDKSAHEVWGELAGKVYSKDELDEAIKHRDDYRAKHP